MAKKETNTKLEITTCDIKGIDSINIESLIHVTRGQQVMLDSDLAMLYGVETRRLNEQVKRNINRFPKDFMFQLTQDEAVRSRSQFATLNTQRGQNLKYLPYAFTRNGIAMLSSVLRSDTAVEVNIRIMRAFTMIPQLVNHNAQIIERIFKLPHRNHDRFLIINDKVYLLGASLKDIGAGLCAVTEMAIASKVVFLGGDGEIALMTMLSKQMLCKQNWRVPN